LIVRASELEMLSREVTAIIKAQIRCRFERASKILWDPVIFTGGETRHFWEEVVDELHLCCLV
jgi:hypothetical protein